VIIWITGASAGIGRATAREYVDMGHTVFGSARSIHKLDSLASECIRDAGVFHSLIADVTDPMAMQRAYDQIKKTAGIPDLVILNAGTFYPTPISEFSVQGHRDLMEVNYFGVLNGFELIMPDFVERHRGQIAIVSSLAGYRGLPPGSAYGASKAGLINFCETVQPELKRLGVDMRLINPGFVKTPLTDKNDFPMPFLITAEQAAGYIIEGLASSKFEIAFPKPFAFLMRVLRLLPNALYLKITTRMLSES
jgi:short-subunit dehydrogenase